MTWLPTYRLDGMPRNSLRSNGLRISPELKSKIFEPLFSTRSFGVGLGLPLVATILEQHGGGVEVDSVEGEGTTVTMWLLRKAKMEDRAVEDR